MWFSVTRLASIASVTALAVLAVAVPAQADARPQVIEHVTNAAATGPTVVAIGDSVMKGHGLQADQAWPALLAKENSWRLTSLASDGSGFVTVGNNGDTFADQVQVAARLQPDIVFIEGSSNDLGADNAQLTAATDATIARLRADLPKAEIVVLSAVWSDTTPPAQLADIDEQVENAAASVGAEYLSIGEPLEGHPEWMQGDDVHPTATGQKVLAKTIESALETDRS